MLDCRLGTVGAAVPTTAKGRCGGDQAMKELASENRSCGYLRLHAMLRREGLVVNRKRTSRLYTEHSL